MLSSYIDSCVVEDCKSKYASMFAPSLRKHVTGDYLKREQEELRKTATGTFGGSPFKEVIAMIRILYTSMSILHHV